MKSDQEASALEVVRSLAAAVLEGTRTSEVEGALQELLRLSGIENKVLDAKIQSMKVYTHRVSFLLFHFHVTPLLSCSISFFVSLSLSLLRLDLMFLPVT